MNGYRYQYGLDRIPEVFHEFRFRGGALPLNLIETVHEWEGICLDRIDGPESWDGWLRRAGLPVPANPIGTELLDRMRELRLAIYLIARSAIDGKQVADAPLERLNLSATGTPAAKALARGADGLVEVRTTEADHASLLAELAREAISILSLPEARRLRECSDPACPTIFIDRSQAGRKLWCSVQCGARTATRNYRRRRAGIGSVGAP
ncbi:ABATE domain-containing protein [Leucobacter weissii]|uniref:ABATE domain-containing protein n=1 Tax=Leucobacter weissii TaxID=1983706 RepID=A0A939SBE3_9MICO|nr:ABATE domain-containing protein [Leucobacter weissii]MBO1901360.1 ABATE domain-containing protein [Leucobacter weissii]